ncbi:hypothetical protein SLE2022_384420 [Rubroshorea leprosula]
MGSSDEPKSKGIDASVGGLVWVRRRNGSWWPGRIMGLDELSEGCLVSPRSGTPVKLLGREDASIDWYNLEKSKRVKAFRCGEYDECIEKAKASAASSNKKAVKYARREDAILHALEIESARLGKDHPNYFSRRDNSSGEDNASARESPSMSHSGKENQDMTDEGSESENDSDSAPELSQSGISFEEPNHIGTSKVQAVQGKRRRTPNDSEDDGTEGTKRMRGLEDLGMGVVSRAKVQAGAVLEHVQQDNASPHDSNTGNCMPNGSAMNGSRGCSSSLKRKRSRVANAHEYLKRKNRRRPLTKVLESTAMVSVPVICDELPSSNGSPLRGLSDSKVSGIDSNESRRSLSMANNSNNSDSTGVSCENAVSLNASEQGGIASHSLVNNKTRDNEISSIPGVAENDSSDRLFDVPFVGEDKPSADFSPIFVSCSSDTPNVGCLGRQSSHSIKAVNEGHDELGSIQTEAINVNISQRIERDTSKWQLKGKRNSRQISKNRKPDSRKYVDMDDEPNAYLACLEHLNGFPQGSDQKVDSNGVGEPISTNICTSQARLKPLMEGQIDGFPEWKSVSRAAELKLLPDGSMASQRSLPYRMSRNAVHPRYQTADFPARNYSGDSSLYDVKVEANPRYRPQDVPLVSLVSKLNGKAIVGHPLTVEVLNDGGYSNECNVTEVGHVTMRNSDVGRVTKKRMKLQSRLSSGKSRKSRKSGVLSNKKIRKLSSLSVQKQLGESNRKLMMNKPKAPVIACVPLKLVFSRINEAVNGSARHTHRALIPGNS